jgi:hypothetical protein
LVWETLQDLVGSDNHMGTNQASPLPLLFSPCCDGTENKTDFFFEKNCKITETALTNFCLAKVQTFLQLCLQMLKRRFKQN